VITEAENAIDAASKEAAQKAAAEVARQLEPKIAQAEAERDRYKKAVGAGRWMIRLWRGAAFTAVGALGGYLADEWSGAVIGSGVGLSLGILSIAFDT